MDSSASAKVGQPKRQRRSVAEKSKIVELTMQPGASVARVAQQHGVNANVVFYWRNVCRQGPPGEKRAESVRLLPVSGSEPAVNPGVESETKLSCVPAVVPATATGAIYIDFPKIHLRIESGADVALLRVVPESLQR